MSASWVKGFAQEKTDSAVLLFPHSKSTLDLNLGRNASELQRMREMLESRRDSLYRIKTLHVVGSASPEGSVSYNRTLSEDRARTIFNHFRNIISLPDSATSMAFTGRDWQRLYEMVKSDAEVPAREEVLVIIGPVNKAENVTPELSDRTLSRLKRLRDGKPYQYLYSEIFPRLRASRLYVTYEPMGYLMPQIVGDMSVKFPGGVSADPIDFSGREMTDIGNREIRYANWALKTNLLYDAILIPNLELEWLFHRLWSVSLEGNVAWWSKTTHFKFYRIAEGDLEFRRWINPRAPWHGLFVGLFAGGGLYDLAFGHSSGYQGEGMMTGLSVGYMWPLSSRFSMEAEIGAGYLFSRYKEYFPYEGHYLYKTTKDLNYFGPLKLKLSLVWRFVKTHKVKPIQSGI